MKRPAIRERITRGSALRAGLVVVTALVGADTRVPPYVEDAWLPDSRPPLVQAKEGDQRGRADWWYRQRAYPLATIRRAARLDAWQDAEREEARWRETKRGREGPAPLPAWTALGPRPIGLGQTLGTPRVPVSGRVSTVVLDPGYDGAANQTVYLGAALGGVWRSLDNGATWNPLTDDQPSLAMGALAIDPTAPSTLYAGTGEAHLSGDSYYGAGLLKTIDGGGTWVQIPGPISTLPPQVPSFLGASFHAIAVDPVAPSTLFAATEVGATMSAVSFAYEPPLGDRGIWKSTDGGLTWTNVNPPGLSALVRAGTDVLIDPLDHDRVFAALWGLGIYRSTQGGEPGTWTRLSTGLPGSGFLRIKLAVGPPRPPSSDSTLYAALSSADFDSLLGIFRSTDAGTTWVQVTRPQLRGQSFYNLALAVDPVDADIVYYGTSVNNLGSGGTLWRSKNGGGTWSDISLGNGVTGGLHVDTHWIAVGRNNRNTLFTANDGGVWRTDTATDTVVTWADLNATLDITQFQSIALHPTDPNRLLGGTQDNGTNRHDGVSTWLHARGGDGGATLIDQSDPRIMYHTFFNRNNAGGFAQLGPEISFNEGLTWVRRGCFNCTAGPGRINPADRVGFYAPLAQHPGFADPISGNVVYFGTHRLYRSADAGLTWTGLGASADGFGADLTHAQGFFGFITAIAVHPVLDNRSGRPREVVWTGSGDGRVVLTSNAGALGGAVFTDVTRPPLPDRFVTDISLDPLDQLRAVVTFSGFDSSTPSEPGHVFLTTDRGLTWTDISGNLPDVPVTSVALDPTSVRAIYVGTDIGVFQTTNGGPTWIRLPNGMPAVATMMLRLHAPTRGLVAATHGRGVRRLEVDDAPDGCGRGQTHWADPSRRWPVPAVMLGRVVYGRAELLAFLRARRWPDASRILARELIAAKLNIAGGANNRAIAATIADADRWLRGYPRRLPYNVAPSSSEGQVAVGLSSTLGLFNGGALPSGPPSCPGPTVAENR